MMDELEVRLPVGGGLGVLRHISPITDKVLMFKHNYK